MLFQVVESDITKMKTEAIVNAAGPGLQMGGGVCEAIFRAAGAKKMQESCNQYGYCSVGEAVITPGFDLPSRFVIHTRGPGWYGGNQGEQRLLYSAYKNSLILAEVYGVRSIAFPLISGGGLGFPKQKAMGVAALAINDYLETADYDIDVYLTLYDWDTIRIGRMIFPDMKKLAKVR